MTIVESPLSSNLPHARAHAPHVIAVTSGKGGVGKSSISVNLGIALSRMGRKVCILDADTGLANINILLGLTPQYSLEHVLFGAKTIDEVMLAGPHNLKVIPGANGITECVSLHPRQQLRLTRELSHIEGEYDYLLVDTAAGISDTTLDFASASHQTLLVITPEPTSLTDAFSLVKLLKRRGKQQHFHVVVNMCASANQSREVFHRFAAAVEKYIGITLNYLGFILQDESLRAAVTMQTPVALFQEDDPSCRSFFRLGESLEAALANVKPVASFSAYWQSLYRQRRQEEKSSPAVDQSAQVKPLSVRLAPADQLRIYLGELRSRLLNLMAQGKLPAEDFVDLLTDLRAAMRDYFGRDGIDVLSEVEKLLASRADDQQLLQTIYNFVAPWLRCRVDEYASPDAAAGFSSGAVVDESLEKDRDSFSQNSATNKKTAVHRYDEQRFGNQQQLLARLRHSQELPLTELLRQLAV